MASIGLSFLHGGARATHPQRMLKLASFGILSALLLSACADDATTPEPTPGDASEVRAVIGPEGGELRGAAGSELEGVTLVVPAGALSEEVEVWLRPTYDGQALPALSERVGLQVEIGSEGELSKPASLTLPFDAGAVARFGESGEDVKVWVRQGEDWSLVEANATSDADVTIALDAFTTAAAGVRVLSLPPSCDAACDASAEAHFDKATCAATSACVTAVAASRSVETFDFAVSTKDGIGYLSPSGNGVIAVVDQLSGASSVKSPALPLASSARFGAVFSSDRLIVGLGATGNGIFSGTATPKVVDAGSGLGAVTTKSGKTLRLSRAADGNLAAVNDSNGKPLNLPPLPIPSNANIAVIGFNHPVEPDSIMVIAVSHELVQLKLDAAGTTLTETARIKLPSELAGAGSMLVSSASSIMVIAVIVGSTLGITRDGKHFDVVSLPFPPSSVAVDKDGRVLAGAAKSPELVLIEQDNAHTGIRLSDAPAGDAELTARIPRAIRASSQGFVVLTQDRGFLAVVPSGG